MAHWLAWTEYWYKISFHSSTRYTPFSVMYDRDPPYLIHYEHGTNLVSLVNQLLEDGDTMLDDLCMHLLQV